MDSSNPANEPASKFTEMPERVLKKFEKSLMPGESVEFQLRAHEIRAPNGTVMAEIGHPWLVVTNQRLLMVAPGLTSFQVRSFKFDQINSIDFRQGMIEDLIVINGIGVNEIWAFWKKLRDISGKGAQIIQSRSAAAAKTTVSASAADPLTELKLRLARGEITLDEFNKLKDVM